MTSTSRTLRAAMTRASAVLVLGCTLVSNVHAEEGPDNRALFWQQESARTAPKPTAATSRSARRADLRPLDIRPMVQAANERLVQIAEAYLGAGNVTGYRGAWCGAFAAMVARKAGASIPPDYLRAKAWARAGQRLPGPALGAVAVMTRRGGGHVGFVKAVVPGGVILVSGNYGHRVAEGFYPTRRVIAFVAI